MANLRTHAFRAWFRLSRPMTLGVRGLVSNGAGEVVLVRHTYVDGWFLPGGGVERGETAETALARELEEEAGVRLTARPRLLGVFSNHASFANDHVMVFHGEAWTACEPTSRGEIAERIWADPSRPPDGTTPGTRRRLAEWVSGELPDVYW